MFRIGALFLLTLLIGCAGRSSGQDLMAEACAEREAGMDLPGLSLDSVAERLWSDLESLGGDRGPLRLSVAYETMSSQDADRLAALWRAHPGLEVTIEAEAPSDASDVNAALEAGAGVEIQCAEGWLVRVATPARKQSRDDVEVWAEQLHGIPSDPAWRLVVLSVDHP